MGLVEKWKMHHRTDFEADWRPFFGVYSGKSPNSMFFEIEQ